MACSLSLCLSPLCACVRTFLRSRACACAASGDYLEENGCMGPRRRPRVLFCRGCITRSLLGPSHSAGRRHWGDASRDPASMGRSRLQPSSPSVAVRTVRCRRCQIVITTCFLRTHMCVYIYIPIRIHIYIYTHTHPYGYQGFTPCRRVVALPPCPLGAKPPTRLPFPCRCWPPPSSSCCRGGCRWLAAAAPVLVDWRAGAPLPLRNDARILTRSDIFAASK